MASLGHIAVGVGAASLHAGHRDSSRRAWLKAAMFWSALSFLPDADVIGFSLGVRYEDDWGHRGATHSLAFAIALGTAIGLAAPIAGARRWRTGLLATLVLTSHALLDTLTDGGLGCALLWPFDTTRYFAPWRPIPVAPIGLSFFSPYGLYVAATELVIFAPLWWFAAPRSLRARIGRRTSAIGLLVATWGAGVWLLLF
jgi:inner membrane protein